MSTYSVSAGSVHEFSLSSLMDWSCLHHLRRSMQSQHHRNLSEDPISLCTKHSSVGNAVRISSDAEASRSTIRLYGLPNTMITTLAVPILATMIS